MSELRQAVEAEIAAHTPAVVPPFDELRARRTRRVRVRSTAAVLLTAAAVAGVAVVPALTAEDDRLPGGLAAAATAEGRNPSAMNVDGTDVRRTGNAQLSGAWTDPQDPTALFVYAGRAPSPHHCLDYAAVRVVEQDDARVVLDADLYVPVVPLPAGHGCGLSLPPPVQHRLELGVPLDGRRLVDTDGDELTVLDVGTLLVPTALPEGYRLPGTLRVGAAGGHATSNEVTLHTYAGPDSSTHIEVSQGLPDKVPGRDEPVHPSVVVDRPEVRGHQAVVSEHAGLSDLTCLRWRESPDHTVSVCSRGVPAPLGSDELQAVAASMRPAGDVGAPS